MKVKTILFSTIIITILGLIVSCGKNSISEIKIEELTKNLDNPD